MKLAVLFCVIALAFSTEVQRKKKKKSDVQAWPDKSWQVDKSTGVVTMTLQKSDKAPKMQQKNEWYAATNSKEYGVESWASLEADGQHYLVGSKTAKNGAELPTQSDELVVFKMEQDKDMERGDAEGMVVYLKPMTPHQHAQRDMERKEMLGPFDPFFYTYAAGAYAMAFTWPLWAGAVVAATTTQSLEKHDSHAKLKNLLHSLEEDVHKLARMDDKSLEKEAIVPGCLGVFPLGVWCSYWLYPFGMFADQ